MKIIIEKELFQWETNRLVDIIKEENDEEIVAIEFYSDLSKNSESIPYKNQPITIPKYFLEGSKILVVSARSNKGIALRKEFNVLYRKKPVDYQDSPNENKEIILDGGEEL